MGHRAFSPWKFPPISTPSLRLASFVWSWRSRVSVWENFVVPGQQEPCGYHGNGGLWWDEISWSQNSICDGDEGGFCATQVAPGAGLLAALALALRDGGRGKREGWSCTLIPLASFFSFFCRNPLRKFLRESVCHQFHIHLWQKSAARLKTKSSSLLCVCKPEDVGQKAKLKGRPSYRVWLQLGIVGGCRTESYFARSKYLNHCRGLFVLASAKPISTIKVKKTNKKKIKYTHTHT